MAAISQLGTCTDVNAFEFSNAFENVATWLSWPVKQHVQMVSYLELYCSRDADMHMHAHM